MKLRRLIDYEVIRAYMIDKGNSFLTWNELSQLPAADAISIADIMRIEQEYKGTITEIGCREIIKRYEESQLD